MTKKSETKQEAVDQIDAAVIADAQTEDEIIMDPANHVLEVNGNSLHLQVEKSILMIRNEIVDEARTPRINSKDDELSKGVVKAWLAILNKDFAELDRQVHLKKTLKELARLEVVELAGYIVWKPMDTYVSTLIPAEMWVEMPRRAGVFTFEYINGLFKITHEMKNTNYITGEMEYRRDQRNAYYKQLGITYLVQGIEFNGRYFPSTSRYVAKINEVISIEDPEVRADVSAANIAVATLRNNEYRIDGYIKKLEGEGKEFKSAVREITLVSGLVLQDVQLIGRSFIRFDGKNALTSFKVTKDNLEKFLNTTAKKQNPAYAIVEDVD